MSNPGPTGEFPEGKLDETDEGELTIAIHSYHGNVRIDFNTPTAWVAMPPDRARGLAELLLECADDTERWSKP